MKKRKKTIFAIIIALLILCLAFSLTACDPDESGSGSSGSNSGTVSGSEAEGSGSGPSGGSSGTIDGSGSSGDGGSSSGNPSGDGSGSGSTPIVPEEEYRVAYGSLEQNENLFVSAQNNTLAVKNNGTFSEGTLSATVSLAGINGDNGIIFGLKNPRQMKRFWEHSDIYYYFFFINQDGYAYLGKSSGSQWIVCGTSKIEDFSNDGEYLLQVSRDKSNSDYDVIRCYVDGDLYVTYKDNDNTDGTGYGLRAGTVGTSYTEISISEEIMGADTAMDDYIIASGAFEQSGDKMISATGNAIAEVKDGEFVYGSLSVTMAIGGNTADNGIIFSLTPNTLHSYWESDVSYYFFFINVTGLAYLGKVDNGSWTACSVTQIPDYDADATYTLRVEKDSASVDCYVNDTCYVSYADDFPLTGTGYGLRAGAKGIAYSDLDCQSSGTITETLPDDLTLLGGKFTGKNGAVKAASDNSLALIEQSLSSGTFSSYVTAVSTKRSGLIFAYSDDGETESYYRFVTRNEAAKIEIDKVVNGTVTNLYSNFAAFSVGSEYLFKVVLKDNVAYCYFGNNLYYNFEPDLTGTGAGLYAERAGSRFRAYGIDAKTELVTVDTLLFGHSYFEWWTNWKNDLSELSSDYNFGTYLNIGIGGSVASHWEKFKESLAVYDADRIIYMIGINDLTGGTSPQLIITSIENTLDYLKGLKPDLNVVLLSVNHCPARSTIRTEISATNELMKQLCAQNDWIAYAELEYAFCDDGINPDSYWFKDGLHPSDNGYVQKIVPAIKDALDGKNQPSLDPEMQQSLLDNAKQLKLLSLSDYAEWSYRAAEWATAEQYYDQGVALIDACTTVDEVNALDLSSILDSLKAIKRNTDYVNEDLASSTDCSAWETANFKAGLDSGADGVYSVSSDGHRILDNRQYTDMSFTFKLSDITNEFGTVGILFRAKMLSTLGVDGYFINIVTEPNYIQIWHFSNAYNSTNVGSTLTYIGGWVFPEQVEETLFRAVVKNGYCYIYTEEDYLKNGENSYGCSADLSYGGTLPVYESGGIGIQCWNSGNGATGKLLIDNISGNVAESEPATTVTDHTSTVVTALSGDGSDMHNLNASSISYADDNTFDVKNCAYKIYTCIGLSDFKMTVKAEADSDVSIAGFLFRAGKNAEHNGVDGYLMNFVSNENNQFIQIYYLNNCYNTDGSLSVCEYIGGWVYPGNVLGTTFEITVEGSRIIIAAGGTAISVSLTGSDLGQSYTPHAEGGIGVVSWQATVASLTFIKIEA